MGGKDWQNIITGKICMKSGAAQNLNSLFLCQGILSRAQLTETQQGIVNCQQDVALGRKAKDIGTTENTFISDFELQKNLI